MCQFIAFCTITKGYGEIFMSLKKSKNNSKKKDDENYKK